MGSHPLTTTHLTSIMAARTAFTLVRKQPQVLATRIASNHSQNASGVSHNLFRRHFIKIAAGAGLGFSGFVVNSQLGYGGLWNGLEKEAVVIVNDLIEAFTDDSKKEYDKE
eukprot:TRINITY_DN13904_c0_g1_i1.p1 TRINITY_DN13904_c0_g1~~TRINITY_DN13904_c0_g1_i1.p1  ORF type:complete len:119 (-),score=38.79 TRINITY_DN13904_c0_g1_i1:218-550(-)